MSERVANISRKTGETDIQVMLNLDGSGKANIDTGIGFFPDDVTACPSTDCTGSRHDLCFNYPDQGDKEWRRR